MPGDREQPEAHSDDDRHGDRETWPPPAHSRDHERQDPAHDASREDEPSNVRQQAFRHVSAGPIGKVAAPRCVRVGLTRTVQRHSTSVPFRQCPARAHRISSQRSSSAARSSGSTRRSRTRSTRLQADGVRRAAPQGRVARILAVSETTALGSTATAICWSRPTTSTRPTHALRELGYKCAFDERSMPSWWREHSSAWFRGSDGVTIDLHRSLPGVSVDDRVAWRVLSRDSAAVLVAGRSVPALGLRQELCMWSCTPPSTERRAVDRSPSSSGRWRRATSSCGGARRRLRESSTPSMHSRQAWPSRTPAAARRAAGALADALGQGCATRDDAPSGGAWIRAARAGRRSHGRASRSSGASWCRPRVHSPLGPARAREAESRSCGPTARRPLWILRHAVPGFRAWYRARRSVGRSDRAGIAVDITLGLMADRARFTRTYRGPGGPRAWRRAADLRPHSRCRALPDRAGRPRLAHVRR